MSKRESKIERDTCLFAEKLGWRNVKLSGSGNKGKQDRAFFRGPPAQVKIIEFKRAGETLAPLQEVWRRWFDEMGFETHTIDSLEDGKAVFRESE